MVDCITGDRVDIIWVNLLSMKLQLHQQRHGGRPEEEEKEDDDQSVPAPSICSLRVTPDQARVSC